MDVDNNHSNVFIGEYAIEDRAYACFRCVLQDLNLFEASLFIY